MASNQYFPDEVSAPGETLLDVLEERGITQADLADRTGRPRKTINEIIKGKAAITPETSVQLERVLGIPASFWNNREQIYREFLARRQERHRLEAHVEWLRHFPVKEMVKRGWLPDRRADKIATLESLLQYFAIASPDRWDAIWEGVAFRKAKKSDDYALSVWLRRGQLLGSRSTCTAYDESRFQKSLATIRGLTLLEPEEFQPKLSEVCGECGVAVVFVPELPRSGASGATLWLSPYRPLLMLSLRYKTDDHLWFTFFHEAGHILLHGRKEIFIEGIGIGSQQEDEANRFASEMLIPEKALRDFRARQPLRSRDSILQLAAELGIAPGIVVGRLQHDGMLQRTHLNGLKRRLMWAPLLPPAL